jgi:hypothetical protein
MSRQEAACWRCGTPWVSEDGPRTTLKVIAGGVQTEVSPEPERVAVRAASTTT